MVKFENSLLKYNNFDLDLRFPFSILENLEKVLESTESECILLKMEYFLNDFYKTPFCICFKPGELAASALFMSFLFLNIEFSK